MKKQEIEEDIYAIFYVIKGKTSNTLFVYA